MTSERPGAAVSIRTLDFLRGAAAVYVLVNHVRGAFFAGGQVILASGQATWADYVGIMMLQLTSLGSEFVILFFVLSGFAMAGSLSNGSAKATFYLKRVIRIWPPYLAAVAVAAALAALMLFLRPGSELAQRYAADFRDPTRWAEIVLYIQPSTHLTVQFWSLPYEILFYAVCPFLLINRKSVNFWLAAAVLFLAAGVWIYGAKLNPSRILLIDFIINGMLFFMSGAYIFFNVHVVPSLKPKALAAACLLLFVVAYAIKMYIEDSNIFSSLCMVAMTALLIKNLPPKLADSPYLNWGSFSYSIYIFHYQFIVFFSFILLEYFDLPQSRMTNYAAWMIGVPVLVVVCRILYAVTERPCNKLVAAVRRRGAPAPGAVARV